MKKFICMGILVLMTVFSAVPAYAAPGTQNAGTQGVITPLFTYISILIPGLSIDSSGKATCSGMASAYDSSHTTKLTVELQKSTGSGCSTIKSWSATAPGPYVADVYGCIITLSTVPIGYALPLKFYNASGILLERKSVYSDTVIYLIWVAAISIEQGYRGSSSQNYE